MKRLVFLSLTALLAAGLIGSWGCSSTGSNPLGDGDPNDPSFVLFAEEFGGVDELTDQMVQTTFFFIDSIISQQVQGGGSYMSPAGTFALEYHGSSGYWYCTAEDTTEENVVYSVVDSIQFLQGSLAVQWPDESTTQIRAYQSVQISGDGIDSASAGQSLVLTQHAINSEWIVLNGSGEMMVDMTDQSENCTVEMNFNSTIENVVLDPLVVFGDSTDDGCPVGGSIQYLGSVDIVCPEASASGNWSVSQVFDDGLMSVTVTSGGNQWSMVDTCGGGSGSTDSAAIEAFQESYPMIEEMAMFGVVSMMQMIDSVMNDSAYGSVSSYPFSRTSMSPSADTFMIEWHPSSQYWYFHAAEEDSLFAVSLTDSIQFLHGETVVQWPDSMLLSGVYFVSSVSMQMFDILGVEMVQAGSVMGDLIGGGDLTINAEQEIAMNIAAEDSLGGCDAEFDLAGSISNLQVVVDTAGFPLGCPSSGVLSSTGDVVLECWGEQGNLYVNESWSVTQTFTGSSMSIHVTTPTGEFDYSESCALLAIDHNQAPFNLFAAQ